MSRDKSSIVYSAHSLQAFADCERQFELQYLEQLKWPAVESEPVLRSEEFMEAGRRFHEMIQRDILGIEVTMPDSNRDPDIARWWENYREHRPAGNQGRLFPEKTLVGSIEDYALTATYDLIVLEDTGRARIFDWKTWRKPPDEERLKKRLQTRIYPYLLAQIGHAINGESISPEDIEMIYWYAEYPDQPIMFSYDATMFLEDHAYLSSLVARIEEMDQGKFALTEDERECLYCNYRSYCGRGGKAGAFSPDELDEAGEQPMLLGSLDDYEAVAF